jgi:hypothetical protein
MVQVLVAETAWCEELEKLRLRVKKEEVKIAISRAKVQENIALI